MSFEHFNGINALFTLVMVVSGAVVVIAQARRISREQLVATAAEWQGVATARSARIEQLQGDLNGVQTELRALTEKVVQMERDKAFLTEQNVKLQQDLRQAHRRIGQLEEQCRRAGLSLPVEEV